MTVDNLQAIAERMRTKWDRMSKSFDENANARMPYVEDLSVLADWALSLLSEEPITLEWLREKWGLIHSPIYDLWFGCCGEVKAWSNGWIRVGHRDFKPRALNQGQFAALMFSLGQYPKHE